MRKERRAGSSQSTPHTCMRRCRASSAHTRQSRLDSGLDLRIFSSYTQVYSVIYDTGSVPRRAIFSPHETSPTSYHQAEVVRPLSGPFSPRRGGCERQRGSTPRPGTKFAKETMKSVLKRVFRANGSPWGAPHWRERPPWR